ncbi:hypothetical protein [Anaerostipes caccae]|uniref:hypothetical protein n=1 Tax=Anaerostipes caccae TaxID=105841 RepID=UPI0011CBC0CF|nr:hypothetical protein [Anaerostipes caccae]
MHNTVEKAMEMDQFDNIIPDVEQGEEIELREIWDGTGEVPEESWSIQLTDSDWINYVFDIVERKDDPLDNVIRITDIELL